MIRADPDIGETHYSEEELPPSHAGALDEAFNYLIEAFFEDVEELSEVATKAARTGGAGAKVFLNPGQTMAGCLPRLYRRRYDPIFSRQFLVALLTVVWKLKAPGVYRLACTAEELVMRAVLIHAAATLQNGNEDESDFGVFREIVFEDEDADMLFDPSLDGIEGLEGVQRGDWVNLRFEDWFKPFRASEPVHPYCECPDTSEGPSPA